MSDTTDDMEAWASCYGDFDDFFNGYHHTKIWLLYQKGKLYWKQKDGTEILIQDMVYSHLKNLKKGLIPKAEYNVAVDEWIDVLDAEIKKRDPLPEILPKFD